MPDDDFAASLSAAASASQEQGNEADTVENDVESTTGATPDTDSAEPEPEVGADGADDASDDGDDDADADDAGEDSKSEDVEAIRQKFVDGDIEEALKDLGVDPKVLGVNGPKLIAMRKGLKEAKDLTVTANARLADAQKKEDHAKAVIADGKKTYGHLVDLKNALRLGEFTAARDILEALAPEGTTYKQIAEGLAKAAQGMSPSEQVYRKKLRELAAKEQKDAEAAEAAKAETEASQSRTALSQKNLEGAKALIAKTPLADVPGAAEKLVQLAAENWDPVKKGLKVSKQELVKLVEKDAVIGQLLELRRLKAKGAAPSVKPKDETPREKTGRFTNRRTPPKVDPQAREKDEFAAAMAEATRMEAQQRRSQNAGKGRR